MVVFKDDQCFAAVSKNPINKYHVMVVPKEHYENFVDLPDELTAHIFLVAKKLSAAVRKAAKPEAIIHMSDDDIAKKGYNLVSHFKFHIIPRFANDGIEMKWARQDLDLTARASVASEIKQHLED